MRKMPTIYVRDWENNPKFVTRQPNPDCAWVFNGEGTATRKLDGTCVRFDGTFWWARRQVNPGKPAPLGFQLEQVDERTGKRVGWEPMHQSPYARPHAEALDPARYELPPGATELVWEPGTYELCGPKIARDPEGLGQHVLLRHGAHTLGDVPLDFDGLARWLLTHPYEGIVWHHPDGERMAKLKRRDIPEHYAPGPRYADGRVHAWQGEHGPEVVGFDPAGLTEHAHSRATTERGE